MPEVVEKISRSQVLVLLRYTLIIAVSYLVLVEHGFSSTPSGLILLIVSALASNVLLAQLPSRITESTDFYAGVIIGDTLWITAALLYSGLFGAEFFYLYFFVILLAGIGESLELIVVGATAVCMAYVFVLSATSGSASFWSSRSLIRIPFLLTAAGFYGYLVDRVRRERQHARKEAETVAYLEEIQRKLADQTRVLQLVLDSMGEGVVVADENGKFLVFNSAAKQMVGIGPTDTSPNDWPNTYGAFFPDTLAPVPADELPLVRTMRGEKLDHVEMFLQNPEVPEGTFFSVTGRPLKDEKGDMKGGVVVFHDITERRGAEERLKNVIQSSLDMIISVDKDRNIVEFNRAAEQTFGYSRAEVLGRSIDLLYADPSDGSRVAADIRKYGRFTGEIINKRKNSETFYGYVSAAPLRDANGTVVGGMGISRDITEHKRAEEALRWLEKAVETMELGVTITDTKGKIVYTNPADARMHGYTVRELKGRDANILGHPDLWKPMAPHQMNDVETWTRETTNIRKDGGTFPVQLMSGAVTNPAGETIGMVTLCEDITQRKRVEAELKTTQLQLIQSAKFESVGQLAAGVAHEVKNPLHIILQGLVYLSRASLPADDENVALVLGKMDNAVKRADRVIKGLLDFSAPSAIELKPAELNAVVEESLLLVKHELVKAHVTLVTELGGGLPLLKLDRQKIEQVFVNLFINAIHAMPAEGTLTVKTYSERQTEFGPDVGRRRTDQFRIGETVVVAEVLDTGTGIPTETLDRLFDPFFTTKPPGQGTGLGLSVARKILELHEGTIDISNRQEGGAQVTLMFKTERSEEDEDAQETDPAD